MKKLTNFVLLFMAGMTALLIVKAQYDKSIEAPAPVQAKPAKPIEQVKQQYTFAEFEKYTIAELDDIESQFRADVVVMLNRMASTIEECNRGIFNPVQTKNSDNPANPEFTVGCGNVAQREKVTRYYFTWMDALNGNNPHIKTSISRSVAVRLCREKADSLAKFPNSVRVRDIAFQDNQDGTAVIVATMKAKNNFDMIVMNEIRCSFNGSKLTDFKIYE